MRAAERALNDDRFRTACMHAPRAFYTLVYGKHTDWETWGKGHMTERGAQVQHRAALLKKNHNLSDDHVRIIKSELPSKLKLVGYV